MPLFLIKLLRYAAVGAIAALVEWATFAVLHIALGAHYLGAALVGFALATLVNYVISIRFVFVAGTFARPAELSLVYAVSATALALNLGVTAALVELAGVLPLTAKIAGTGAAFAVNFGLRHRVIFPEPALPGVPGSGSGARDSR